MLFNSYVFIFAFLPAALAGYFLLGRRGSPSANAWLLFLSFLFYGYWDVNYLPLLMGSILMNWLISGRIIAARAAWEKGCAGGGTAAPAAGQAKSRPMQAWFLLGLLFNVCLLGYYKYLDFFILNLDRLGLDLPLLHLVLPLGISFFTITQMIYLLDCYVGVAKEHGLLGYALFVSFFPHLLAGPILYYKPMMAQFADDRLKRTDWENLARGGALFVLGLMKKTLIADSFIAYVDHGFGNAASLTLVDGWLVTVCYGLQLYFDFSGYSDMAIGVSRMLNIRIPPNFRAPFRAVSLANFWQRWHISLTNAITACIYMPIVQSFQRITFGRMVMATFVAMFIAGIWHGAGWTFVVFALMHAGGLAVCQCWKRWGRPLPVPLARAVTLLWVLLTFVFFRAGNMGEALQVLAAMGGLHGAAWPGHLGWSGLAVDFTHPVLAGLPLVFFPLALLLVVCAPESNELVDKHFRPDLRWAAALAALFVLSVLHFTQVTSFLYFQF
ncbi:MAG: MBOAT family protein [Desulfovibrio sp.]|nr:MBOAT family protein [Desulfovibrio sp.]